MIYTKNKEKFQLFTSCFGVYLYLIIFHIVFSYNSPKIIFNKDPIQTFFIKILINLIMVLPIIVLYLVNNSKNIKPNLIINFKFKIIIKKIFWTITFSLALISIIYPLLINQSSQIQSTNINISNFVNCLVFALPEEIIFRWFLQEKFEKLISNKFIATTLVGLLFGIIHFFGINYSISSTHIIGLIFTLGAMTVIHFFLNLVKEKSDSIIVPTIVHALYNFFALL